MGPQICHLDVHKQAPRGGSIATKFTTSSPLPCNFFSFSRKKGLLSYFTPYPPPGPTPTPCPVRGLPCGWGLHPSGAANMKSLRGLTSLATLGCL